MNWGQMIIGKKITIGFGLVITLLGVVGVLSDTGVGSIVDNAEEVIHGNQLDGELAQKGVDHLNWAKAVNALLTDKDVTKPLAYTCLDTIDKILAWHAAQVQAMHAAEDVYAQKTAPALHQTQELLHELRRSLPIDRVKDRFHPIG